MGITPIDASIPLAGKDPVTTYGEMMKANDLASQSMLRQKQVEVANQGMQAKDLEMAQTRMDQADAAKLKDYMTSDPSNAAKLGRGDMTDVYKLGLQPKMIMDIQKHGLDIAAKTATMNASKVESEIKKHDETQKTIDSLMALEDGPTKVDAFYRGFDQLQRDGLLPEGTARPSNFAGTNDELKHFAAINGYLSGALKNQAAQKKGEVDIAKTQSEIAEQNALADKNATETMFAKRQQAAGVLAAAAQQGPEALKAALAQQPPEHQALFNGITNPDTIQLMGMKPEDQAKTIQAKAELARQTAANAETARHNKTDEGLSGQRNAVERARLAVEQQKAGFEQSGGVSDVAKSLAAGDYDGETARRILGKNPGLMAQIKSIDPTFSQDDLDKKAEVRKEFSSSSNAKAGGQVIALNTLVHHADLYLQAQEALKNGTFRPGNSAYNTIATMFGSAPPQNAQIIGQMLAGEGAKVATGGVPAQAEIHGFLNTLGSSNSDEQAKGAAQSIIGIAAGKLGPLQEKVNDAKLQNVVHVVGPEAKDILERRGFDSNTLKPKAAAPPFPAKLRQADVGKTYTNRDGKQIKITAVSPDGTQFK